MASEENQTEKRTQRKLAAILCADVVGYSRLMGANEEATVETLTACRQIFITQITIHNGTVVDAKGDSILAEFASVVNAVEAAVVIQQELVSQNTGREADRCMEFRIGINLGDVLVRDGVIYGDGVNVAARLESLADPGGITVSRSVYEQIRQKLQISFEDMGDQQVKNISEPVRAYKCLLGGDENTRSGKESETETLEENPPLPDQPSIAVLPFTNMSGDPEQEYFSDGICEDIITDLSKISQLMVIARNSSFAYKGRTFDMRQVGRELGVRFLLEGSVRKAGNRIRLTAQLIEAATGNHIWAERYDRMMEDIFDVQDEITNEIVTALDVKLIGGEQAHKYRTHIKDPASRELFYQGRNLFYKGDKEANKQAFGMFTQLIHKSPDSYLGYVWCAWALWWRLFRGWSENQQKTAEALMEMVQKALALNENSAGAHVIQGGLRVLRGEYDEAVESARKALELSPNGADVASLAAFILIMDSKLEEGIRAAKTAIRLSPIGQPFYYNILGVAYRDAGRYEEAIEALKKALAQAPDFSTSRYALISVYCDAGRDEEARKEAKILLQLDPGFSLAGYTERLPFIDRAINDRLKAGLQRAGLI